MKPRVWLALLALGLLLAGATGCGEPEAAGPEPCLGAAPSELTAPGRFVLGEAAEYEADLGLAARAEEIHASLSERRALGWRIAEKVLAPTVVTAEGLEGVREVPTFQTFYDVEDLRRVIRHVMEARRATGSDEGAPLTATELDEAFAWNTTSVYEQEAWPTDRLEAFVAGLESRERVQGAGGINRVVMNAVAAGHLLTSRDAIARCADEGAPAWDVPGPDAPAAPTLDQAVVSACGVTELGPYRVAPGGRLVAEVEGDAVLSLVGEAGVCDEGGARCEVSGAADVGVRVRPATASMSEVTVTFDERQAPYAPCLGTEFPSGAVIVKTDYRRVGFGVLLDAHDTSAEGLRRVFDGGADWGEGVGEVDPGAEEIFTVELPNGNRFRLAALHVMTKELDHWAWATLWWSADPEGDFGADRPAALESGPFAPYKMCAVTWFDELDPDPTGGAEDASLAEALAATHTGPGGASWCSNPYLENEPGNAGTNCIGCHQHAGTGLALEEILLRDDHGRALERRNFPFDYTFAAPVVEALFP